MHTRLSSEDAPRLAALDSFGRKNRRTEEMIFKRATAFSSGDTGGNHKYIPTSTWYAIVACHTTYLCHGMNGARSWQLDCRPTRYLRAPAAVPPPPELAARRARIWQRSCLPCTIYCQLSLRLAVPT